MPSLVQILTNIYEYENVFAESDVKLLADDLYGFVLRSLITEIQEEVIAVVLIQGVTTNTPHQGSFQTRNGIHHRSRDDSFSNELGRASREHQDLLQAVVRAGVRVSAPYEVAIISAGRMKPRIHV